MTINILSEITLFISYIKMFSSSNLYSFVPLFPKKRLMFPFSLVPPNPWETLGLRGSQTVRPSFKISSS